MITNKRISEINKTKSKYDIAKHLSKYYHRFLLPPHIFDNTHRADIYKVEEGHAFKLFSISSECICTEGTM